MPSVNSTSRLRPQSTLTCGLSLRLTVNYIVSFCSTGWFAGRLSALDQVDRGLRSRCRRQNQACLCFPPAATAASSEGVRPSRPFCERVLRKAPIPVIISVFIFRSRCASVALNTGDGPTEKTAGMIAQLRKDLLEIPTSQGAFTPDVL